MRGTEAKGCGQDVTQAGSRPGPQGPLFWSCSRLLEIGPCRTEERQATAARQLLESAKKTKIQLSKFNDFIGCIESFMNRRASHLANIIERYSEELYEMESFYRQEKGGTRNLKECITSGKATIL